MLSTNMCSLYYIDSIQILRQDFFLSLFFFLLQWNKLYYHQLLENHCITLYKRKLWKGGRVKGNKGEEVHAECIFFSGISRPTILHSEERSE